MRLERHELCVIGAGTAGFAAAEEARSAGRDVVLVTGSEELGGTCILRGCMPAKAVLAAAQYEGAVEKARDVGVRTGAMHLDLPAIIRRKRALVDYFAEDRLHELDAYPLARGDARFVAPDTIEVAERGITADRFVIATGAEVVPPAIEGLETIPVMTSTGVLEMTSAPNAVAVIGGGPIGCAFAQFFARLGTRVTLFQDAPELLRADDPDVGAAVRAALERDGVEVVVDADVRRAQRDGDVAVLFAETARGAHGARADVVLLATNRRPRVERLDLGPGGIEGDRARGIVVDATLRSVSNERVYAAGDALGRRSLVHSAAYAGRLAARNAFAAQPAEADWERWEAHALYTQPQVAVAGLTERQCRERGIGVRVATVPASEVGKALVSDETEGFVKMLVRADDRRVVGITLVLDDAIDLAGEAIALIDRGATAPEIAEMPHLHPTMSELLARVAEKLC
ncbi:MAG TPA: NAD(P)/FAD-dependent oxidoreductase [Candidatus Elarobacter sp.]|jgi:pyruvate/2-oxoglutarate dehydrogenase complex dihydrolipoamide dehydrogenase (E3) component